MGGFAYHEVTLENLTNTLENPALTTGNALNRLSTSLNSVANVVTDNRLALDYLLDEQGGVCAVINKTCSTYVNNSGQIEMDINKIYEQATWLHRYNQGSDPNAIWSTIKSALPSLPWFLTWNLSNSHTPTPPPLWILPLSPLGKVYVFQVTTIPHQNDG